MSGSEDGGRAPHRKDEDESVTDGSSASPPATSQHGASSSRLHGFARAAAGGTLTTRSVLRSLLLLTLAAGLTLAPYAYISGATVPGGPPAPTSELPQPSCASPDDPAGTAPVLRATVERGSQQTIRVTYNATALQTAESPRTFTVSTAGAQLTVRNATGFSRDGSQFVWSGSQRASLTYRFAVSNSSSGLLDASAQFGTGENWSLAPLPAVAYESVNYTVRPDGLAPVERFRANLVYVGSLSSVERTVGCQNVTVSYPPIFERTEATSLADTIESTSAEYPLGHRARDVSALIVPWNMGVGGYTIGNFMTINPKGNVSAETIATHEYIHTRQRNSYEPEMQWLTEAIPSYYMFRIQEQTGRISTPNYALQLYAFSDRATWGNSFEERTSPNHYFRGAATLAALDQRIRETTDGRRSLLDVIDRLNRRDGPTGLAEFEEAVSAVAGESFDGWIDRHVVRGVPVEVATPDGGMLPREGWVLLSVYDTLLSQFPPFALAFVVLWYALFGTLYEAVARLWG